MATSRVINARALSTAGTASLSAASVSSGTVPTDCTAAANASPSTGAADSTNSKASRTASSTSVLGGGLRTMSQSGTPSLCPRCGSPAWNLPQHERWHRYADA